MVLITHPEENETEHTLLKILVQQPTANGICNEFVLINTMEQSVPLVE